MLPAAAAPPFKAGNAISFSCSKPTNRNGLKGRHLILSDTFKGQLSARHAKGTCMFLGLHHLNISSPPTTLYTYVWERRKFRKHAPVIELDGDSTAKTGFRTTET
jgi:hypothetical protein